MAFGSPSLSVCNVTCNVLEHCIYHAHFSECEEVLGVLIGHPEPQAGGKEVLHVYAAVPLFRQDRRRDRVEVSPEQLMELADTAAMYCRPSLPRARVVGWYHSHPHITPQPSNVDLRTQFQFQQLSRSWIGLIVAVFAGPHRTAESEALHARFGLVPSVTRARAPSLGPEPSTVFAAHLAPEMARPAMTYARHVPAHAYRIQVSTWQSVQGSTQPFACVSVPCIMVPDTVAVPHAPSTAPPAFPGLCMLVRMLEQVQKEERHLADRAARCWGEGPAPPAGTLSGPEAVPSTHLGLSGAHAHLYDLTMSTVLDAYVMPLVVVLTLSLRNAVYNARMDCPDRSGAGA